MKSSNERNGKRDAVPEPTSMRAAVSTLPSRGWVVASLLAVLPAVGFYVLIHTLTEQAEPLFVFFYWITSAYVLLRKTYDLSQVYMRAGVLMVLEILGFLAAKVLV
jgi:hypothetical protein